MIKKGSSQICIPLCRIGRMFMIIINRYKNCFSVLPFNFHRLVLPRFIKRADERAPAVQISRLQFFISSHSNQNRAGGTYGDIGIYLHILLAEKLNPTRTIDKQAEVFYNVNYVNVNYSVKNSIVDCKYLLFLQDFFFRLKPKQCKKCQYS